MQPTAGPVQLRENYRQVRERMAAAAARVGRTGSDVMLVAVTKNATPDQIRTMVELGQLDLGENRVQQLVQRAGQLEEFLSRRRTLGGAIGQQVRWHMIGHLQRNKIKQVAPLVQLIHSVDSLRLAEELHNYAVRQDVVVDCLLQVNASGETSKHGVAAPAVIHLAEQIDSMMHLRLRGLMTMAAYSENPEDSRGAFARTREIFTELQEQSFCGRSCNILSMGMTNDFEVAIEEGSNLVRIGRALFGEAEA